MFSNWLLMRVAFSDVLICSCREVSSIAPATTLQVSVSQVPSSMNFRSSAQAGSDWSARRLAPNGQHQGQFSCTRDKAERGPPRPRLAPGFVLCRTTSDHTVPRLGTTDAVGDHPHQHFLDTPHRAHLFRTARRFPPAPEFGPADRVRRRSRDRRSDGRCACRTLRRARRRSRDGRSA
jgi:hypothetical protein